jgi:3D (Asp-Asp-Asp) domain-containing protein
MAKKVLKVQKYIRDNGLDALVKEFKLKTRDYPHKVLIKYDQIESSMGLDEVQGCRGLILEKDTWNVLCFSFEKFFNAEEGHAAKIDWNTAKVLAKLDGSMIQVYWDARKEEWFAATTGTAEGEGEVNNKDGTTFNGLFWNTVRTKYNLNVDDLKKGTVYVFELMTPYNIVVTPHTESSVALLAVRNLKDLSEYNYEALKTVVKTLGVPLVEAFDMNVKDVGAIKRTFDGMPFTEEGYVVVDANFNRIKIKNPAYVSAHHLKGKMGNHHIMGIIKTNEIDEFIATFKEREDEIRKLESGYNTLITKLVKCWGELSQLRPKNITPKEKKQFAMNLFDIVNKYDVKQFSGLFFGLNDGKVASISEYMMNYDDKKLYHLLIE